MLGNSVIGSPPFSAVQHPVALEFEITVGETQTTCSCTRLRIHNLFALCILYLVERSEVKRKRIPRAKEISGTVHDVNRPSENKTEMRIALIGHWQSSLHHPLLPLQHDDHPRSSPLRPLDFLGAPDLCNVISNRLGDGAVQHTCQLK